MSNLLDKKSGATDVVVREQDTAPVDINPKRYSMLGWLIVLFGVGGFMIWAIWAPLDKGAPLSGTVMLSGNRKAVQHPTGGTVQDILVKEGDIVKAGQVLVRMNSVQAAAALEITRGQYYTARAAVARLMAERAGQAFITFPADLTLKKDDPRVLEVTGLQTQLFQARRASLQNEMAAVEEAIGGLKIQAQALQQSRDNKKRQLEIINEQLAGLRDLGKDGYVARNRVLDLERSLVQLEGALNDDISNIGRAQRQVAEVTLRRAQRQQDYQKEVGTFLSDYQKEAEALQSRINAQEYDLANVDVKAPSDGVVVGMNVFTKGGVVGAGFKMMDVAPVGDELVVDGMLPVNLIDKVHPGLPVELIFSALNIRTTPHVAGVVVQVSPDRLVEERTGMPYYRMTAKVTPAGMKALAKEAIRPGMPVDLFIKTGERSMMDYLLKPIIDRVKTSMTEE